MNTSNNKTLLEIIQKNQKIHGKNLNNTGDGYIYDIQQKIKKSPISDITDEAQELQYVDLVMEGGTVWGLALIGYTYTLEQADIRFLNIAGTSAGSINATILASLGPSSASKSTTLLNIFSGMDLKSFVDGGLLVRIAMWLTVQKDDDNKYPKFIRLVLFIGQLIILNLFIISLSVFKGFGVFRYGLNPGKVFKKWLEDTLEEYGNNGKGVKTTANLFSVLKNNPPLKIRYNAIRSIVKDEQTIEFNDGKKQEDQYLIDNFEQNELAIIAADITTQSKITFPKMANLYWDNAFNESPAEFVRASMSIPVVFEPVKIQNLPNKSETKNDWLVLTGYDGEELPKEVYLVDGGVLSNFPIDVFHSHDRVPLCPTFGAKLGVDRKSPSILSNFFKFIGIVVDTAANNSDFTFLFQNEDYKQLITYIDTSKPYVPPAGAKKESPTYSSLDFNMSTEKQAALFALGAKAAHDFICGNNKWHKWKNNGGINPMPSEAIPPFDWEAYKKTRFNLLVSVPEAYRVKKDRIKQSSLP